MLTTFARFVRTGRILPSRVIFRPRTPAPAGEYTPSAGHTPLPGWRAVAGYSAVGGSFAVWLYDTAGHIVHRWPLKTLAGSVAASGDAPHAIQMFPDGSVVLNFDNGPAMLRLDWCGRVMWRKPGVFHHAIERADDGSLWTWEGDGTAFSSYQYLVRVDAATGKTLQRIGLIESIIAASPEARTVFGLPPGLVPTRGTGSADLFHPNSISVLHADMAKAFPQFAVGDLLLSFRAINLIIVLDPKTMAIKWRAFGPWIGQHDADFQSDGKFSVINNNTGRNLSDVVIIDPRTRHVQSAFRTGSGMFYTAYQGKHRQLPNGDMQLVATEEGRVLEFDTAGNRILTISNRYTSDLNGYVSDAEWLPLNFFAKRPELCPATKD